MSRRPSEEIRVTSPAKRKYAEAIVKYFDKHPESGVDLEVDEVLADMDTWALRHTLHKEGRPWLSDEALTEVRDEVHRVGKRVLDRQSDLNRANNKWMRAHKDSLARTEGRAEAAEAGAKVADAKKLAAAAVRRLVEDHGEPHQREIVALATSAGAAS